MNKIIINRSVLLPTQDSKKWKAHQQIGRFALGLDRLPDAAQVRKARPRSNPLAMVEPLF